MVIVDCMGSPATHFVYLTEKSTVCTSEC